MNYQISESNWKYVSVVIPSKETVLIGVPRRFIKELEDQAEKPLDYSVIYDDISVVAHASRVVYYSPNHLQDFYVRFFRLSKPNQQVISELIERLKKKGTIKRYVGYNFEAVHNFLTARYQQNFSKIFEETYYGHNSATRNATLDSINKIKETATPRSDSKLLLNIICASHLISPEVIYTGTGKLFMVNFPDNLSVDVKERFHKTVLQNVAKNADHIDIKQLLLQEHIIDESHIIEWTIKTFDECWYVPKTEAEILDFLLDILE